MTTAMAVVRIQPLHYGHALLFNHMIGNFQNVIVGIGSVNAPRDFRNPFSYEDRKQMIRNIYGGRIKIIQLEDIGTEQHTDQWCDYVLDRVEALKLPKPNVYVTGSNADAEWYKGRFPHVREFTLDEPFVPANPDDEDKAIHIINRYKNTIPSATEIRTLICNRGTWKQWVPSINHRLIDEQYPKELFVR